ncbi:putative transcription factor C2H2 family [Lupinus albus]|uniref:Putative transcription factor C2H2 family n=1 Tax=Lupinus albus TaxID=3870 RepID=A0A6A4P363_LUPAL|nr:putative transcription factor C2H2 family [Lupinus albus]
MGLPNILSPSEGILCCFLRKGVFAISIVKGIVMIILHILGINLSSSNNSQYPPELFEFPESFELLDSPSGSTYIEEIKSQTPTLRFDSLCCYKQTEVECIVCLTQFEPESEINHLSCGHIFHKVCLEKWLNYLNITCPLCRAPLMLGVKDETPYF